MNKKELEKLENELGIRPTTNSNHTKEDLINYAEKRKVLEVVKIDYINQEYQKELKKDNNKVIEDIEEYREPLSINYKIEIEIELSWGGDADGFKLLYVLNDKHYELDGGVYYWADWGVYEEVDLTYDEAEIVEEHYSIDPDLIINN